MADAAPELSDAKGQLLVWLGIAYPYANTYFFDWRRACQASGAPTRPRQAQAALPSSPLGPAWGRGGPGGCGAAPHSLPSPAGQDPRAGAAAALEKLRYEFSFIGCSVSSQL